MCNCTLVLAVTLDVFQLFPLPDGMGHGMCNKADCRKLC